MAKILAVSDDTIRKKLEDYSKNMKEEVIKKDLKLQEEGYKAFE